MKKTIAFIIICALIFAYVTILTGCSENNNLKTSEEKNAVCFVIANTANSQGLNFNSPLVQDTVYSTIRNYGFIAVVNADGNPEIVHAASYDIDKKYKSASKEKLDMDARSKATNITISMQNVVADDPEVDYLESLRLSVRSLSSLQGYDSKTIILIGTGLSTIGVMNFRNNIISAEPEAVVNLLKEKSEIPDFTNITVYAQQLCDVASPQKELTSAQRIKLQKIYSGIIEAGGGTFIYNDIISNPVNNSEQYPKVTPVELPDDTPISFNPEVFNESKNDDKIFEEPIIISEEQVSFVADTAEYLNPEEALQTIKPIAEYLVQHSSISILLAGTTAGDEDSEYSIKLSLKRGERVKSTLVELGVDESKILAIGLGSKNDPWHIWGVGYDGAAASSNRKVVLLDATSETAKSILKKSFQ